MSWRQFHLITFIALLSLCNIHYLHAIDQSKSIKAPFFTGTHIPSFENKNWKAPASSSPYADATAALAKQGFPCPKGGEYRSITISVGNPWNGGGYEKEVHGWVMPAPGDDNRKFAICWNGLVYPIIRLGVPANINDDMEAVKSQDIYPFSFHEANPDSFTASEKSFTPTKICLLYLAEQTELANTIASQLLKASVNTNIKDPYLQTASSWAWSLYDRTVNAHMRGDDELSLITALKLANIRPLIEAEAGKRGIARPVNSLNSRSNNLPYLQFCESLETLIADEQERIKETPHALAVEAGPTHYPNKDTYIRALINDLNMATVRQSSQPGGVYIAADATAQALIKEGDNAVPALLEVIRNDNRLTRSVSFSRDFKRDRSLISVSYLACMALLEILETSDINTDSAYSETLTSREEREILAKNIEAYWKKTLGISKVELFYRILRDDTALPQRWIEAASHIVQTDTTSPLTLVGYMYLVPMENPIEKPKMRGEELRSKNNPSVTDLLIKRIKNLEFTWPKNNTSPNAFDPIIELTLYLTKWDANSSIPYLKRIFEDIELTDNGKSGNENTYQAQLAKITLIRIYLRDPAAQREYSKRMQSLTPSDLPGVNTYDVFKPWIIQSDNSTVQSTANTLFNSTKSQFYDLTACGKYTYFTTCGLIKSPLLYIKPFRNNVLRGLKNHDQIGTISVKPFVSRDKQKSISVYADWDGSNYQMIEVVDQFNEQTKTQAITVSDLYALQLSEVDGMPEFKLSWPSEKRHIVIEQLIDMLNKYQTNLHYVPLKTNDPLFNAYDNAHIQFPCLDHPADAADVASGRAIFTLSGQKRKVDIRLPKRAYWKDPSDHSTQILGIIWQAEEQYENGIWKRYYGFVGGHMIMRVNAEDVQLL